MAKIEITDILHEEDDDECGGPDRGLEWIDDRGRLIEHFQVPTTHIEDIVAAAFPNRRHCRKARVFIRDAMEIIGLKGSWVDDWVHEKVFMKDKYRLCTVDGKPLRIGKLKEYTVLPIKPGTVGVHGIFEGDEPPPLFLYVHPKDADMFRRMPGSRGRFMARRTKRKMVSR
jgi:hypothetical protein